jgi:tight adherence protein C
MDTSMWAATAATLAAGGCAGLLAWWIGRTAPALPREDRQYLDPPPPALRVLWLPIRWLAPGAARLLSPRAAERLAVRLRQAGLEFAVLPAQFVAARIVWAVVAAGGTAALLSCLPAVIDGATLLGATTVAAAAGAWLPITGLRDRIALRRRELLRQLPFCLDLVTLCVEGGLNLQGAIAQAVAKGPRGVLRDELQRALRDIRAGKARTESLQVMADRIGEPAVTQFVAAVAQAEALGMSLGPVLRAQADQRRTERFLRAEKAAMQAPVKMLLPLIAFIFPCTFIVLFFPIAMKLLDAGL